VDRRRRGVVTLIALGVIWVILAFAVEPSTSTSFDIREGRGVAASMAKPAAHPGDSTTTSVAPVAIAVLAAMLLVGRLAVGRAETVVVGGPVRVDRWRRATRRGPPAFA
jgi:hypothetical protein